MKKLYRKSTRPWYRSAIERMEAVPVPNPSCLVERNRPFSSIGGWQQVLSTAITM